MLLNITGGVSLGLFEVNEAAEIIAKAADPEANIIFGAVIDEKCDDEVRVTVIATGFDPKTFSGRGENPIIEPFKRGRLGHPDLDAPLLEPGR